MRRDRLLGGAHLEPRDADALLRPRAARAGRRRSAFTIDDLVARARAGDGKAVAALQASARYLGLGLGGVVNIIDPDCVFIGGEIIAAWDLIESTVRAALAERALTPAAAATDIVIVSAEEHPRLRGAAMLVDGAGIRRAGRGLTRSCYVEIRRRRARGAARHVVCAAQTPTGTILGSVKDAQGAVVPGATVTATNLGTQYSRSAVTDGAGEYALRLLPVGNYQVVVNLPGFKNYTQSGIVLEVGRNARVDATIELGAVSETVSVVGDSPLVDTASSSLSRTVGQNEVLNLPLVNRDLYSLLSITGGVTQQRRARTRSAGRSRSPRSTDPARRRWAPSTSSWMAGTTPRACAAPATRRRTRKRCRSSAS